jgi:hypothetical protein
MEVELQGAKKDERMEFVLNMTEKAIGIFTKAIEESSEEHQEISFKAFQLMVESEQEAKAVFDVIMTAVAIELNKQAQELIKKYTFFHSIETLEKGYALYLHCRKVAPPTKEEIEALAKEEEKIEAEILLSPSESAQIQG